MTQGSQDYRGQTGNPFGRAGGKWMTTAKLRALFSAGRTYDEIAEANERSEGWRPSRAAVKRKYEAMGMPPRRSSHKDLLPWKLRAEHSDSLVRHMLQAESRARQHKPLSETDRKLTARLNEILFGRGTLMVVTYHPEVGFAFVLREDTDDDIVRVGVQRQARDVAVGEWGAMASDPVVDRQ